MKLNVDQFIENSEGDFYRFDPLTTSDLDFILIELTRSAQQMWYICRTETIAEDTFQL